LKLSLVTKNVMGSPSSSANTHASWCADALPF
jgi:hypothetical protein